MATAKQRSAGRNLMKSAASAKQKRTIATTCLSPPERHWVNKQQKCASTSMVAKASDISTAGVRLWGF